MTETVTRTKLPTVHRDADQASLPPSKSRYPLVAGGEAIGSAVAALTRSDVMPTDLVISDKEFEQLLAALVNGIKLDAAIDSLMVSKSAIEGYLRADPKRLLAWREALLAGVRRGWSVEIFEEICDDLCVGVSLREACAKHGKAEKTFLQICRRDSTVKAMYEEARAIAAELEADDLRAIADQNHDDILDDGKGGLRGNSAAVQRSKLRVDTRLRLMTSYSRDRFAENVQTPAGATNVTVNISHADRLESARARAKRAREAGAIEGEVVELVPSDAQGDTSWLES